MPKSSNIAYYPSQYFDIASVVAKHQEVRVSLSTPSEAKSLRLDFYGFRRAVKEMGLEASAQVRANVEAIHVKIHGCEVIFSHADDSPAARALTRALDGIKAENPDLLPTPSPNLPPPIVDIGTDDVLLRKYFGIDNGDKK